MLQMAADLLSNQTDREILALANRLAGRFALVSGWAFDAGYRFDLAESPRSHTFWKLAAIAFEELASTDIDSLDLDDEGD